MSYGYFFNSSIFAGKATINRKAETSSAHDVAKGYFPRFNFNQLQPFNTLHLKQTLETCYSLTLLQETGIEKESRQG